MSNKIQNHTSLPPAIKVLYGTSAVLITISIIAYSILGVNYFYPFLPAFPISSLILYTSPAAPALLGLIPLMLGIILHCRSKRKGVASEKVASDQSSETPSDKQDLTPPSNPPNPESTLTTNLSMVSATTNHSPFFTKISQTLPSKLQAIKGDNILGCVALLFGDYTGNKIAQTKNESLSLSFLIENLRKIHNPSPNLKLLIEYFEVSYTIACLQDSLIQSAKNGKTYPEKMREVKRAILELLKEKKTLFIPSGYAARPSGHFVIIRLDFDGRDVKGSVINSGEGSRENPLELEPNTGKAKQAGRLQLEKTSFQSLENSWFLDTLLHLSHHEIPKDTLSDLSMELNAFYTINDFQEGLLPLWPGASKMVIQTTSHVSQRNGTCTMKPFIWVIKELLGEEGEQVKGALSIHALRNIKSVNRDQAQDLLELLKKGARRFEKLRLKSKLTSEMEKEFLQEHARLVKLCAEALQTSPTTLDLSQSLQGKSFVSHFNPQEPLNSSSKGRPNHLPSAISLLLIKILLMSI